MTYYFFWKTKANNPAGHLPHATCNTRGAVGALVDLTVEEKKEYKRKGLDRRRGRVPWLGWLEKIELI